MSIVTRRGRPAQEQEAGEIIEAAPRRRRRWRLAVVVVVFGVLLWSAPMIVAHSRLLQWILAGVAADLQGTIHVESASLGWFSPIAAQSVEVRDAQGQPLLQTATVKGDKSLAAMLWNTAALGQFQLEQPKLTIRLRKDGSNLEDTLAKYLDPNRKPAGPVGVALKIIDGSVTVIDEAKNRTWQIEKLQLSLDMSADAGGPLRLDASGNVVDPQRPGRFAVAVNTDMAAAGEVSVDADSLPLAMFESLVGRFAPQTQLAGRLGSKTKVQWGGGAAPGRLLVAGDVTADDLTLGTPTLGTDQLQLSRLHVAGQSAWHNDRLEVQKLGVQSDFATVSLSGDFHTGQGPLNQVLAALPSQTCDIQGRVDLAQLANMLPNTLRIRQGTRITSGQVQLALSSQGKPGAMAWQGRLEAGDLTAVYEGRQLAWEKPVLLTLAAHESAQGPVVDQLKCESSFLKLHGAGTREELVASASFNLKQLATELDRFVDLGEVGLGGDGWAQVSWRRTAPPKFEADGELQLHNLQLALPGRQPWVEENLQAVASASGHTDFGADTQLQAAELRITTGSDQIAARLAQPVIDFRRGGAWPVEVRIQGQLEHLPARLAAWFGLKDWALAGAYQLDTKAAVSLDTTTVRQATLTVDQFRLASPAVNIQEPRVTLAAAGNWTANQRRLQLESAALGSSAVTLQADRLVLAFPPQGPWELAGSVQYRGNIQPLCQWFADPTKPPTWRADGQFAGTAQLVPSAGTTSAQLAADISNVTVLTAAGDRFHEPLFHLAARGAYQPQTGAIQLDKLDLASGTVGGNAAGRIVPVSQETTADLSGEIRYDLEKICGLLRPYLGPYVQVTGSGTGPAWYRGPLGSTAAEAGAGLQWQSAEIYGFQVGPGHLKAKLADGILKTEPLDLAVSQGQVLLAPQVRLAPEPRELTLPPGPFVRQVQINPRMCAAALKYVAPVLAEVTTAQGTFSIELEGCRVPLSDPAKSDLAGRFIIHSVEVGPGPLIQELALLLGRAAPAKLRQQSVVPFRMANGRVQHQGLELIFPEVTIRTGGSVGLDQTLAMVAEMPIPDKWLGNNVVSDAIRGQAVRLPIGGTLKQPRIDRRALDTVNRELMRNSARKLIETEATKQLERLFGPPPKK